MDRLRRQLWTSRLGTLGVLAPLVLGLLGCPQLLQDDFSVLLPTEPGADLPDDSLHVLDGRPDAGNGGSGGSAGNGGTAGSAGTVALTDSGTPPVPLPDANGPPPPPGDADAPACVPAAEACDGRDNDCNDVVDDSPVCPSGCRGVVVEGRGGMFCGGEGATFANAEARCSAQGMRPVVIDSAAKSDAVLQAVLPLYTTPLSDAQNSLWIDAHDGETEGTWHWGLSGTVFWLGDSTGSVQNGSYVFWAPGKPNNSGTGAGEDCAVLHVDGSTDPLGSWNDETCDGLHTFLCEAP
ncbi:MAG TPA: C-type lectin domain-containing protein [Polyangiaceae bacterium]|nr:C-type lectin domain-containing protein [Polyangiaceae bacterium]